MLERMQPEIRVVRGFVGAPDAEDTTFVVEVVVGVVFVDLALHGGFLAR